VMNGEDRSVDPELDPLFSYPQIPSVFPPPTSHEAAAGVSVGRGSFSSRTGPSAPAPSLSYTDLLLHISRNRKQPLIQPVLPPGKAASAAAPGAGATVDPMRLASRWRSQAEWACAAAELEAEPAPSELNTVNSSGLFSVVSTDKLSVKYLGSHHHGHDVGVVQADRPAPTRRAVYYFEMSVRNAGYKGQTSIGFTNESFKMRRQPG